MDHPTFFEGLDSQDCNQSENTVADLSLNTQKHDFTKDLQ
jgi:hypothetical protein